MPRSVPANQLSALMSDFVNISESGRAAFLQGIQGADAAFRISGLELGGLLGSLSAGAISDRLIRGNTNPSVGNVGLRVKVRMANPDDLDQP